MSTIEKTTSNDFSFDVFNFFVFDVERFFNSFFIQSFNQIEKVNRNINDNNVNDDMIVFVDVDSTFWNDLQIFLMIVLNVSRFVAIAIYDVATMFDIRFLRSTKNIEYFDSTYENFDNSMIVNVDRHVFYRNVYNFIDKLKKLKQDFFESKMKEFVSSCLRDEILFWHSIEFIEFEKNLFKNVNVDQWINVLFNRFKKRVLVVMKTLQIQRYIMIDCRNDKTFRQYVQNIMRYVKIVEFTFIFNQFVLTWNNFDFDFRMQISKFTIITIMNSFFEQFDFKTTFWHEMIVRRFNVNNNVNFFDNVDKFNKQINKQNRERQDDFFQQFDVNDSFSLFYWSSFDYTFYQFKNFVYQN